MKKLTLLIPAKYEKDSLPIVLQELDKYKIKKIVILQKNDQETFQAIKKKNCKIIFQKDKGYGAALIKGINSCKTKYLCIFNADGSFDPREIKKLYKKLNNNDFVFASRYKDAKSGSDDDSLLTFIGNKIFTLICNIFLQIKISDVLYTFFVADTEKIKKMNLKSKDFTICIEIPLVVQRKKFIYSDVSSYERKRLKGFKKVNEFKDGFLILIYIMKSILKI